MTVDEILAILRERDAVLYVEDGRLRYRGPRRAPDDTIRAGIDEHRAELITMFSVAPTKGPAPAPFGARVNPGMLITLGQHHGYPRLPLRPGISIAEGYAAWRTFTFTVSVDMLVLAAQSSRTIWSDDPMTSDLYHVEPDNGDDLLAGCCSESRPCPDDFDLIFESHRDRQEERYLEGRTPGGGA